MTSIPKSQFIYVSFPDCDITFFSMTESQLECCLTGIHIVGRGMNYSPVRMTISNWQAVTIERYNTQSSELTIHKIIDSGELVDICEYQFAETKVSVAGFERYSGQWQTYTFTSPSISIDIDE